MTLKDYIEKRENLRKQIMMLAKQFKESHEYKHLEGKKVKLTSYGELQIVIFEGFRTDFDGSIEVVYRKIKKNGEPFDSRCFANYRWKIEELEDQL